MSKNGEEITEYNDIHVYTSKEDPDWAVEDGFSGDVQYEEGPVITHWCRCSMYGEPAWNYVISPIPGNWWWDLQKKHHDPRMYYRCTECMAPAPEDVRTVFILYRDRTELFTGSNEDS